MKKQNNGRNQTVITTTNTKDSTEPKEKQIQLPVSLRDYFAAKAMQGFCASPTGMEWANHKIAAEAYAIADAMLAAREKA